MRLTPEKLHEITGLSQPAAQARWFKRNLGAEVPSDQAGPILTRAAFERLLAAKLGLHDRPQAIGERPRVKLREGAGA